MNRNVIIIAVAAVALMMAALWHFTAPPGEPRGTVAAASPRPAAQPPPAPARPTFSPTPAPSPTPRVARAEPQAAWEQQIDRVLESNASESQAALVLINMLPGMPPEGQEDAAEHISNLLEDKDYQNVKPILLNPAANEGVLDVLFTDLMNRGDSVKLRTFLEIARIPNHPFAEEARSDLEIYMDEDFGTDWARWATGIETYLRENPDEPEEE